MADELQSPAPAPQPDHQTLVLTDPPPKKHHVLLWGLCIAAVALTAGGFVYAYWQYGSPIGSSEEVTVNAWEPASILVEANVGYAAFDNQIYFGEEPTYKWLDSFYVWLFTDKVTLPTYGFAKSNTGEQDLLYIITEKGILPGGRPFDPASFVAFRTPIEDDSCGYECRYDAKDKNYRYFRWAVYPPLPKDVDSKSFSIIYRPDGFYSGFAKENDNLYASFDMPEFFLMSTLFPHLPLHTASFEALGGGYFKDKNAVYHETWQDFGVVEGADSVSAYYDLETDVVKDSSGVYYYGRKVEEADPNTFEVVYPDEFYRDKEHVFETGLTLSTFILKDADPLSFTYDPSTDVAKDKNRVWVAGKDGMLAELVLNADSKTFVALNPVYYKDIRNVYYGFSTVHPISVDVDSFKVFKEKYDRNHYYADARYAADKNYVYYEGGPIMDADVNTFALVSDSNPLSCGQDCQYDAEDKNHKYLRGEIVTTTTSQAKRSVLNEQGEPNGWYSTDGQYIYIGPHDTIVKGADLDTFVAIGGFRFARDKNHLYWEGEIYSGETVSDPTTFTHVDGVFYKDSRNIYAYSVDFAQTIPADVNTFEALDDEYYGKDSVNVFFGINVIEGADPKTFVVLNGRYGKDATHAYNMANLISEADVSTFEVLPEHGSFAKDKYHVFTKKGVIQGADPATFVIKEGYTTSGVWYNAQDKDHKYAYEEVVE